MQRTRYAMKRVAEIKGIKVFFADSHHFKEFVVNFDDTGKTVADVNKELLRHEIFGGKDLSRDLPELAESALYCITEIHSQQDIERLVNGLAEVTG